LRISKLQFPGLQRRSDDGEAVVKSVYGLLAMEGVCFFVVLFGHWSFFTQAIDWVKQAH